MLFAVIGLLAPTLAAAEQSGRSFDHLRRDLKRDQIIVVVDTAGRDTHGRVVEVSPDALTLLVLRPSDVAGRIGWASAETRTLAQDEIAIVFETEVIGERGREIYRAPTAFGDLHRKLRAGERAIVIDRSGYHIAGRVVDVTPFEVRLRIDGLPEPRAFTPDTVRAVLKPGAIWDGAVKGGAIGGGIMLIGLGQYADDYPGAIVTAAGIGAAIGVGIDALWGPKTVYRATNLRRSIAVAPVMSGGRRGLQASIRF